MADTPTPAEWHDLRDKTSAILDTLTSAPAAVVALRARCDQLLASAREAGLVDAQAAILISEVLRRDVAAALGPLNIIAPNLAANYTLAFMLEALE